jgi:uncharacterized protein (DUF1800 family)
MSTRFARCAAVCAAALLTASLNPAAQERREEAPQRSGDQAIVHVLNRLGFGPTPAAVERARRMGLAAYLDEQLHPERIDDSALSARLSGFSTLAMSSRELAEQFFVPAMMQRRELQRRAVQAGGVDEPPAEQRMRPAGQAGAARLQRAPMAELSQQKILRAAYSEQQLAEVLADFWFNHFNVFIGKGLVRTYLTEYERDAIRPHVLGRFRDLLGATAHSPAMLFYLDNWQSTAAPASPGSADTPRAARPEGARTMADVPQMRRRGLNENYARELMELHTLGVDGGYTQKDVQEVARAFTGWTIANPRQGGPFRFDPRLHDDGEKVVLGHRIAAGGGKQDGERVLDILARHPSTARFIATKLARRFVADEPPQALVDRAAETFRKTDGDLRSVVRAIVTSPEFFAPETYRAKTKSPLEFVVSAIRVTGTDLRDAMPVAQAVRELGMPLYGAQPPTGYPDRAEAWINTGALLNRMNFAIALAGGRLGTAAPDRRSPRARVDRSGQSLQTASGGSPETAAKTLLASGLANDVSNSTAATVAKATTASQAVALILGSPEFQKR